MSEPTPPQNIEAEESVLGAVLRDATVLDDCGFLEPQHFYRLNNQRVYEAVLAVHYNGDPVDLVSVAAELEARGALEAAGGRMRLADLAGRGGLSSTAQYYARVVREKAQLREMIGGAAELIREAHSPGARSLEIADAFASLGDAGETERPSVTLGEAAEESREGRQVVRTGFDGIDRAIGGLGATDSVVLAARPGMGKTSLALNIAANLGHRGIPVLIFSLEMGRAQLAERMIVAEGRFNLGQYRAGYYPPEQVDMIIRRLSGFPIRIDDNANVGIERMRGKARAFKRANRDAHLGLIIADYLQLMSSDGENQNVRTARISRGMKLLAKELQWPVLTISQLNRGLEQRNNKRPNLGDLRDSGAIEQDADIVAFIYREAQYRYDYDDGKAEFIVAKNRHGQCRTVQLEWHGHHQRFVSA